MNIKENTEVDKINLRDYFATKAMQGELASQSESMNWADEIALAQRAYLIADAMLKEREK